MPPKEPLPDPIPGWWVTAGLEVAGWAQTDLAEALRHKDSTTVNKWTRAGTGVAGAPKGINTVTWFGILHALDLPKDWRPPKGKRGDR